MMAAIWRPGTSGTRTEFRERYIVALLADIAASPDEYGPFARTNAERTVDRMMAALDAGTANITGSTALRRLARTYGIPHTVAAITALYASLED